MLQLWKGKKSTVPVIISFFVFTLCLYSLFILGKLPASQQNQEENSQAPNQTEATKTAPRIHFDILSHDFGRANQNETLKHTFTFKNVGTDILVIKNVKSS